MPAICITLLPMEHDLEHKLHVVKKRMRAMQRSYDTMRTIFQESTHSHTSDVNDIIVVMRNNRDLYENLMWEKHGILRDLNHLHDISSARRIIPTSRADLVEIQSQCGICLSYHMKIDIVTLQCKHSFGEDCFSKWAEAKGAPECPNCKRIGDSICVYREPLSTMWSRISFTPNYSVDETPPTSMFGGCCIRTSRTESSMEYFWRSSSADI